MRTLRKRKPKSDDRKRVCSCFLRLAVWLSERLRSSLHDLYVLMGWECLVGEERPAKTGIFVQL